MSTKTTINSFVKQFLAVVKGDGVKAQAEKAFRQASSALKSQISSLEGDTINLEDKVTEAQEKLAISRVNNGQAITNREYYIESLLTSKNNVVQAEKNLKKHIEKIDFLKAELTSLEEEVDSPVDTEETK